MISFRIFAFNTWTVMWKPPFVKRRGEGRKCGENNSRDLLILWSKLMKIFHFTEWIKVCDDGTFTVWLRTLYSSTTWCWGEVSASHLPHYTLLFMKGALYLKLGALSSWSLMRAVTVLHKHCLSPLWTSGFDRLWWAVTSLIRLIYFRRKKKKPPAWLITTKFFPAQLDSCPEEAYTYNILYTTVGLVFRLLSANIVEIHSVLFSQHWTVKTRIC